MIKGIEKSLVIWSFWMPFNRMLETISPISSLKKVNRQGGEGDSLPRGKVPHPLMYAFLDSWGETYILAPQEVKKAAYIGLVCPVLDYGSLIWDPPPPPRCSSPGRIRESMQKRTARFVTGNYNYETGRMTGILGQLKWESLKKRRKDNRHILLYKGLKGKASVPADDLIPKTRHCRNQHSMAFQTYIASTDIYKGSFFPQTIRDWNALPDSLISFAEDAEDCVAKFTSLVRARD